MGVLAALISALLLIIAFPPFGVGALAVVAPIPFLWAVRRAKSGWMGALYGAAFGLAFFLGLIWWIGRLGFVALVPLLLTPGGFHHGVRRSARPGKGMVAAAVVGGSGGGWALMELVRERFPVGGLSWGMLGYPVGEYAATRGATQWIGTSGWSVVLMAVAAGAVVALEAGGLGRSPSPTAAMIGLGLAGWAWPGMAEGEPLRVAIVQGNTPCPGTHCARRAVRHLPAPPRDDPHHPGGVGRPRRLGGGIHRLDQRRPDPGTGGGRGHRGRGGAHRGVCAGRWRQGDQRHRVDQRQRPLRSRG